MTKKEDILQDQEVKRWYDNLRRGSNLTAGVYLRRICLFCEQNSLTPAELVLLGKKDMKKLGDLLLDHVTWMELEKYSPGYITGIVKSVRSWLEFNHIGINRKIKISNRDATPTLDNEKIPTKEELKSLLFAGDERAGAAISLIAMSGVRPEVLGDDEGRDGLMLRDLPELKIGTNEVEFTRKPALVEVRKELSKTRNRYFTFLPEEGCGYLGNYLNLRIASGEVLKDESPVLATKIGYIRNSENRFMTTKNVSKIIRQTMRPRFKWRPYVLRSYFDTNLLLAESHGKLTHPYRMFFMGHKGDIEARYTTSKGILPVELVEDMRNSFHASSEYLETSVKPVQDKKEMLLEMWRQQAKMYGIDPLKIRIEKQKEFGEDLTIDQEQELLMAEIKKITMPQNDNGKPYSSKVVHEDDLVPFIEEGWEIVRELSENRFLLKRPNHILN